MFVWLYVHVAVCLCDCIPVWLYVCVTVCLCDSTFVWLYACVTVCLCECIGVWLYLHLHKVPRNIPKGRNAGCMFVSLYVCVTVCLFDYVLVCLCLCDCLIACFCECLSLSDCNAFMPLSYFSFPLTWERLSSSFSVVFQLMSICVKSAEKRRT